MFEIMIICRDRREFRACSVMMKIFVLGFAVLKKLQANFGGVREEVSSHALVIYILGRALIQLIWNIVFVKKYIVKCYFSKLSIKITDNETLLMSGLKNYGKVRPRNSGVEVLSITSIS